MRHPGDGSASTADAMKSVWATGALFSVVGVGLASGCGHSGETATAQATPDAGTLLDPAVCGDCHADHFSQWSGSMHAYASQDPVFLAMNKRMQRENPSLGTFCVKCHAPMAVLAGPPWAPEGDGHSPPQRDGRRARHADGPQGRARERGRSGSRPGHGRARPGHPGRRDTRGRRSGCRCSSGGPRATALDAPARDRTPADQSDRTDSADRAHDKPGELRSAHPGRRLRDVQGCLLYTSRCV